MSRFFKRKKFQFIKVNFSKEQTSEDCIGDFEEFLNKVRFGFLQPTEDDGADRIDSLWGIFPIY